MRHHNNTVKRFAEGLAPKRKADVRLHAVSFYTRATGRGACGEHSKVIRLSGVLWCYESATVTDWRETQGCNQNILFFVNLVLFIFYPAVAINTYE